MGIRPIHSDMRKMFIRFIKPFSPKLDNKRDDAPDDQNKWLFYTVFSHSTDGYRRTVFVRCFRFAQINVENG